MFLVVCVLFCRSKMLSVLVEHGVPLNAQDTEGNTALHTAAQRGHVETVCELLELGAQLYIRNKAGRTALHLAGAVTALRLQRACVSCVRHCVHVWMCVSVVYVLAQCVCLFVCAGVFPVFVFVGSVDASCPPGYVLWVYVFALCVACIAAHFGHPQVVHALVRFDCETGYLKVGMAKLR